jgi:hypothetical protein
MTPEKYGPIVEQLKQYADRCLYISDREKLFQETRNQRRELHTALKEILTPELELMLGLDPLYGFEVHELRRSMRVGPDGQHKPQVIVALTQSREIEIHDSANPHTFRGGSTLVVDLSTEAILYAIFKRLNSEKREKTTAAFMTEALQDPLRALLLAPNQKEPFAGLHLLADIGS